MQEGNELLGEGLTLRAFLVFLMQDVEISPCFQACCHMHCDLKMCTFARVLFFRGNISADGSGDSGGTGLVPGPVGDHSDPSLRQ